jgi:hypothetical protein
VSGGGSAAVFWRRWLFEKASADERALPQSWGSCSKSVRAPALSRDADGATGQCERMLAERGRGLGARCSQSAIDALDRHVWAFWRALRLAGSGGWAGDPARPRSLVRGTITAGGVARAAVPRRMLGTGAMLVAQRGGDVSLTCGVRQSPSEKRAG